MASYFYYLIVSFHNRRVTQPQHLAGKGKFLKHVVILACLLHL